MEIEEHSKSITDYLEILPRRKYTILVSALLLFFVTIIVTLVLPPIYRSSATILIEQQKIPTDFIKSTVMSSPDERIMQIQQAVMTVDNINKIIEKYQLYPTKNADPLILSEKFRDDFTFEVLSADVIKGGGGKGKVALAFKLAFDHKSPILAQKVASEITNLFLNENIKSRTEGAIETTKFLEEEARQLQENIQKIELEIAKYKEKNNEGLPEMLAANVSEITRIKMQLELSESQEQIISEQRLAIQAQLAVTSPFPVDLTGKSSVPDNLPKLKADYADLLAKYSENHPDVVALKHKIDNFKEKETVSQETTEIKPTNPVYIQYANQLNMIDIRQNNLIVQRKNLIQALQSLQVQVSKTPQLQRELDNLTRDLDNTKLKYKDVSAKHLEAKLSQSLEQEQKSEKFSVLESATVPSKPEKPDRLKVLLIGLALSIGMGIAIGGGIDLLKSGVRGDAEITALTGMPMLVVIPYIQNKQDIDKEREKKIFFIVFCIAWLICILVTIHFLFTPLNMMLDRALNKII